jgi:16S rRNA A1518/A1519 N6-dimethyltransferase RsmA/KsgA/DIM1 with predicted DNA glycosylase/AP lyase activity
LVPRGAFHPVPRVDSAVIAWRFTRGASAGDRAFVDLVRGCFQKRRKTLRNSLSEQAQAAAVAMGIDLGARPETLTPDQFWSISERSGNATG